MSTETTDPYCLSAADAATLLAGAPWSRLISIGDSSVEGTREPTDGYLDLSWVDRIDHALQQVNPELVSRNLGVRGLLAAQVREQQLAPALEFAPDLAIVSCGGNDMFRSSFDAGGVERELTTMIEALRSAGSDVITLGIFDVTRAGGIPEEHASVLSARIHQLAAITKDIAVRHGALFVPFTDHPAGGDRGIYTSDHMHVNARGHAIVAAEIIRQLAAHRRAPAGPISRVS